MKEENLAELKKRLLFSFKESDIILSYTSDNVGNLVQSSAKTEAMGASMSENNNEQKPINSLTNQNIKEQINHNRETLDVQLVSDRADFDALWPPDGRDRSNHSSPNGKNGSLSHRELLAMDNDIFQRLDLQENNNVENSETLSYNNHGDNKNILINDPEIYEYKRIGAQDQGSNDDGFKSVNQKCNNADVMSNFPNNMSSQMTCKEENVDVNQTKGEITSDDSDISLKYFRQIETDPVKQFTNDVSLGVQCCDLDKHNSDHDLGHIDAIETRGDGADYREVCNNPMCSCAADDQVNGNYGNNEELDEQEYFVEAQEFFERTQFKGVNLGPNGEIIVDEEVERMLLSGEITQDDLLLPESHVEYDQDGDRFCTCSECLKHLRIEKVQTADKSTMCPEEPPYVLMCEICEGLLENQLQKTEKDGKRKEEEYKKEIRHLKRENEEQQKILTQNMSLSPEAKIEATMQHEITRLTSENLDLREHGDKQSDQIRKLKKMLKVYSKRLKDGEAAEIAAEIEKDESKASMDNVATVKHRERNYMGMLEYKKDDENVLIKNLIIDLKPKVAAGLLPGLPAYVLFMCVRHTDYVNDDEKVRSLLTNTINSIRKCVKKHHKDLDRVTLWLANTCRLLHTLKQYSGEKAFQSENTSRQNEHCLRNFDLSEYRQVFSDLAVWIYQSMIKLMEETIQAMIVPAVLEHEAIAGLSASKPSGMRGRSSSSAMDPDDIKELSLDSLMKAMNKYSQVLTQHAVDPELVKQIFRQVYYYICAGALNNLLLRKDMCNWSKGMQIRYNLSHLEQWLRDNKLQESAAQVTLEPIVQASQLLQARKTVADVDSICEMCSKLTTSQIVKILNLYTPVDEFEERVPIAFIRKIQEKLKVRNESDNTLLMDTKFSFPVTFPFNPSSIALETIEVPQQLHLGFVNRA